MLADLSFQNCHRVNGLSGTPLGSRAVLGLVQPRRAACNIDAVPIPSCYFTRAAAVASAKGTMAASMRKTRRDEGLRLAPWSATGHAPLHHATAESSDDWQSIGLVAPGSDVLFGDLSAHQRSSVNGS
jgi:hypothetical protein